MKLILSDVVVLQERRDAEEGAEKAVTLHAQLQLGFVGRFARDIEAGQDVNTDIIVLNEFSMRCRDAHPGGFRGIAGFPDQTAALLDAFERISVREGFGIAAEDDVHVVEFAVHLDLLGSDREIIIGGRAFFLRTIFRVRHDEQFFLELAGLIAFGIALFNHLTEVADDFTEVFARGNHAPTANGMKTNGNRFVR